MKAYVIAQIRGLNGEYPLPMAKALEGSPLFLTRARAAKELDEIFDPADWEVRAVAVKLLPRRREGGGRT